MPRLTIALDEKDHLALKLLSLRENRRLSEVIDDAIKFYLSSSGGYGLRISDAAAGPRPFARCKSRGPIALI
jgi:hypothetical protein